MRAVLQRVSSASVTVEGTVTGRIGLGLLVLVSVDPADTPEHGAWLAQKLARLRVFDDGEGRMDRSVVEAGGEVLVVSQFTLHATTAKGNRPSFNGAARPEQAIPLYELFLKQLEEALGRPVATGRFGAMMEVALTNSGPVTLILDSQSRV